MRETVKAIVLATESRKDSDRLAWLLCDFGKVLRVYVRGARSGRSKLCAAAEPFVMGSYDLYRTGSGFIVDDAEIEEQFFALRGDLKSYSLAGYFAQLLMLLFPDEGEPGLYALLGNCLHLLASKKREPALVKAIFELRIASAAGYRPQTAACADCGSRELTAFSLGNGVGYCADCASRHPDSAPVGGACMKAIAAACDPELRRAFGFTLSGESLENLAAVAEAYLLYRIEEKPASLAYYRSLVDFERQLGDINKAT